MTYTPSTPNPPDIVSETQPLIKSNFEVVNTIFDNNHFNFTAASDNGKHRQVTLPDNSSPTATGAGEINAYCDLVPDGGSGADAYIGVFQKENNGEIGAFTPFAYAEINSTTVSSSFNIASAVVSGLGRVITFTTAAPNANYLVFASGGSSSFAVSARSETSFTVNNLGNPLFVWVVVVP